MPADKHGSKVENGRLLLKWLIGVIRVDPWSGITSKNIFVPEQERSFSNLRKLL
jgi:hypothetical protein